MQPGKFTGGWGKTNFRGVGSRKSILRKDAQNSLRLEEAIKHKLGHSLL